MIINTVKSGVNVLDTAPWYGDSERVVGMAIKKLPRSSFYIHTKVGRYAKTDKMFDFTKEKTYKSVQNSLKVLNVDYLDCVQVHDPEFCEDLSIIVGETLVALDEMREKGIIRRIGITGYPLQVQREIIERSTVKIDQSLSYGHLNLHDVTLLSSSFSELCKNNDIALLAAAPLSMGLLTPGDPPSWHPAPAELKDRCKKANVLCEDAGASLPVRVCEGLRGLRGFAWASYSPPPPPSTNSPPPPLPLSQHLATIYSLAIEAVPCTLLGVKNSFELERMLKASRSLKEVKGFAFNGDIEELPLTATEQEALRGILEREDVFGGGVRHTEGWNEV